MERLHLSHPLLVHFTVGLLTVSVALYFVARFVKSPEWRERFRVAAELNLWVGAAITALTVGAGMIAFDTVANEDARHIMIVHAWLAVTTFALFAILAAASVWPRKRPAPAQPPQPSMLFLAGLLVALAALAVTGYLGGELVFTHAVGVEQARR